MNSAQPVGEITHIIIIRSNSSVSAEHRAKFGSRYFYFGPPKDYDERGIFMEIAAKEKV